MTGLRSDCVKNDGDLVYNESPRSKLRGITSVIVFSHRSKLRGI